MLGGRSPNVHCLLWIFPAETFFTFEGQKGDPSIRRLNPTPAPSAPGTPLLNFGPRSPHPACGLHGTWRPAVLRGKCAIKRVESGRFTQQKEMIGSFLRQPHQVVCG